MFPKMSRSVWGPRQRLPPRQALLAEANGSVRPSLDRRYPEALKVIEWRPNEQPFAGFQPGICSLGRALRRWVGRGSGNLHDEDDRGVQGAIRGSPQCGLK